MARAGWRAVFMASGVAGVATAVLWFTLAPAGRHVEARRVSLLQEARAGIRLLGDRDLLLLSCSYALHSAVFYVFIFWFFRYLIDGRGFDLLTSGVWGSVPPFTAFALAPLGGLAADRLTRRYGPGRARRRVAISCLVTAAALVVIGANAPGALLAIGALSLSVAAINAAEGSFWATATGLGGANPGAAGGVMNLMGNLGGVVSIWAVPRMRDPLGWAGLLGVWAGVAVVAALLWLAIRVDRD
jgi:ACS family glucarate transporter-like MFS transporter